jgi:hypothetical protein
VPFSFLVCVLSDDPPNFILILTISSHSVSEYEAKQLRGVFCAGIFKQSMWARNRVGLGLSYRHAKLQAGGINSLESIPELLKSLKFRALHWLNIQIATPDGQKHCLFICRCGCVCLCVCLSLSLSPSLNHNLNITSQSLPIYLYPPPPLTLYLSLLSLSI